MKKSDAELIHKILSGDEAAFSALVQKYQKSVHALAWRKIKDFHIAEEITQDTFLQVYKKLPTLKDHNQFAGWLYVIADRRCIAWLRKKKHAEQSLETTNRETLEETAYACYISEQREEAEVERRREVVQNLLEKLPESERTVVVLHYLGEMTCEAISKFLGVSPNTVKSRLSRARKRLRTEESIIKEFLGSVPLSPNLTENIMRDIANVQQTPPSGTKPLLPLGALGTSVVLIIFLIGASNQYLSHFQLPYSFEASSENTIEIVDMPVIPDIKSKPDMRNRVGSDAAPGKSSSDGSAKGETSMQNNLVQDYTKWKLPEGAKARLGKGYAFDMAYSPDGTLLATGGTIGIWIYDAHTGEELNLLIEHMESVSEIAFSPDSQLLASNGDANNGEDNTIQLWNPHTGQLTATLIGHQEVTSLAFSPDGKTLASGGDDETIRLWDVRTGELRLTFAGHAGGVSDVIYSPDGKTLASCGSSDEMIYLWDAHTGEFLRSLTGHTGDVNSIAYSPNSEILAAGIGDGTIRLWESNTGHLKTTLTVEKNPVRYDHGVHSVLFSPDGKTLVSNRYDDDMIQFWDVASGEHLKTIESPPGTTEHIVFSPDGSTLVNAGSDGTIRFWDVATITPIRTLIGYADMLHDMTYSPDGSKIVAAVAGPSIQIWETHTGKLIKSYFLDSQRRIDCIACSPDGTTLAYGAISNRDDAVWLINIETSERSPVFKGHKGNITAVAFSPDGKTIASGDDRGTIHIWDAATGETIKILTGEKEIWDIGYAPDGEILMTKGDSGIRFWDISTGETVKTVQLKDMAPELKIYFGSYSPDGRQYAAPESFDSDDMSFFNADTGEVIRSFPIAHKKGYWSSNRFDAVLFFEYLPDGRTLVTGGWDSTILLWEVPE